MRKVLRTGVFPPESLTGPQSAGAVELAKHAQRRLNGRSSGSKFLAYKSEDVRTLLEELFHGKCAYCESQYSSTAPVDIEHYRPKGAIEGQPNLPGYWWLAMDWSNLLPSCIDCNRRRTQISVTPSSELQAMAEERMTKTIVDKKSRSGKKDAFPIAGTHAEWAPPFSQPMPSLDGEIPLLLNPCEHEPSEHIAFEVRLGSPSLVLPIPATGDASDRGAVSIDILGLNRLGLVQARTRLLRHLEFLGNLAVRLYRLSDDASATGELPGKLALTGDLVIAEMRKMAAANQPYSSLAASWMRQFKRDLESAQKDDPDTEDTTQSVLT